MVKLTLVVGLARKIFPEVARADYRTTLRVLKGKRSSLSRVIYLLLSSCTPPSGLKESHRLNLNKSKSLRNLELLFTSLLRAYHSTSTHLHMIRHFSKKPPLPPLLISFDAYNCLYTPREPIFKQYHDIAASYGVHMEVSEVRQRFTATFHEFNQQFPNYGKSKNWSIDQFWDRFLKTVFAKANPPQALVDCLINHFASDQAYKLYSDVIPTLDQLKDLGVVTAIASNADSRVLSLIYNSMNLSQYFKTVILSYNVDCAKPSVKFFDKLITAVWEKERMTCDKDLLRSRTWHVGDDVEKDVGGATKAGLNAILIDRHKSSGYLEKEENFRFVDENFLVVHSLGDILLAIPTP